MKTLRIFQLVFLAILIVGCEKEPLQSDEDLAPNTMYVEVDSNGEIQTYNALPNYSNKLTSKSSNMGADYWLYNSAQELTDDCADLTILRGLEATGGIGYTSLNTFYFGVYLEVTGGEDLIDIVIRNTSADTIYQERRMIGERVFFGIASEEPMGYFNFSKVNFRYYQTIKSTVAYLGNCDLHLDTDTDGDGVPDDEDLMPNSNMEETVVIEDCDSSVENTALGDGYMFSDRIDELEAGEYKNHGQYVKASAQYLASLVKDEILSNEEKDLIMECVGSSSIGKER